MTSPVCDHCVAFAEGRAYEDCGMHSILGDHCEGSVEAIGEGIRAVCRCGWQGPAEWQESVANEQLYAHLDAMTPRVERVS